MIKIELFLNASDLDAGEKKRQRRSWKSATKVIEWPYLPPPGFCFRIDKIDAHLEVTGDYEGKPDDPEMLTTVFVAPQGNITEVQIQTLKEDGWTIDPND